MAEPFATGDDVAALFQRPLTDDELRVAEHLCGVVSRRIRRKHVTLDARIGAGSLTAEDVADVVAAVVSRAIKAGEHGEGVRSQQESAGPFSQQLTFANPLGSIYFTADELETLAEGGSSRRAFSVDLTPTVPVLIVTDP